MFRHVAIDRPEAIEDAFRLLDVLAESIFPVKILDVRRARELVSKPPKLSARGGLHLAVMEHHDIRSILSCDRGFDEWPDVTRLPRK